MTMRLLVLLLLFQYHTYSELPVAISVRSWKSVEYDHYNIALVREETEDDRYIDYVFTCRFGSSNHPDQHRRRMNSKDGTTNLAKANSNCDKARGTRSRDSTATSDNPTVPYSMAAHRVLIALRCAASRRPFSSVTDPFYISEVQMLRPGTTLPSPSTVSRDVLAMYEGGSIIIKEYFQVSLLLLD